MTDNLMTCDLAGKRLLLVGGGGFIGGFIAAEGLKRGMDVTVAVRESTSRRYLADKRLEFLVLDYDNAGSMTAAIGKCDNWDYIIYNLGATKCMNYVDFKRINCEYLRKFTQALKDTGHIPECLLYVSSLSALGPGDEKGYTPLSPHMHPNPDTRYGQSKVMAEQHLEHFAGIPYVIFRPTGVYGPHEQDYLMMIKSIDSHFDFAVGFRKQLLTFVYVDDLVEAMFQAFASGVRNKKYIISESRAYTQTEFRRIVSEALGGKWVIPVKLPLWAVWAASAAAEKIAKMRCATSTLNRDKFKIMRQRNWSADISAAVVDFGFNPKVDLREGIRRTVEAYLAEKNNRKNRQ